ncbi:head-tail joining protein [Desulfotignum balticum]|uniref:head-tail joining protein n=1 Tax=Desulfotignum balticum TaxID=115781 RepID=UPI0004024F55|nr:hypothetical protein [Desulfotignum balticum]
MTFKEQMADDLKNVFYNSDEFADPSVYTPVSGSVVDPCPVMVDHDVLIQADGYDVNMATLGTTVTAMVSDVGKPARGDTFAMESGTVYTVQRIERYSQDGLEVTVVVK